MISFDPVLGGANSLTSLVAQYMAIERRPVEQMKARKAELNTRSAMFSDLKAKLDNLKRLADELAATTTLAIFKQKTVVSSDAQIITASADGSAPRGAYNLDVIALAKSHRVQSNQQSSATASTGLEGTISIQGVLIEITSGNNTLIGIRDAINDAQYPTGKSVVASVVDNRLVIQSSATGAANRIAAYDVGGNVLSGLGITSGAPAPLAVSAVSASSQAAGNEAVKAADGLLGDANAWHSATTASPETPVWIELDLGSTQTVSRLVWGRDEPGGSNTGVPQDYTIEVSTDGTNWTTAKTVTGHSFAAAGEDRADTFAPVSARYVRMSITATNDGAPPAIDEATVFDDTRAYGANELQAPQDNTFVVDGITIHRAANTGLTDVLPGVTLNLLATTTTSVSLSVNADTAAITEKVKALLAALNDVNDYIKAKSSVDGSTYVRGPLAGEYSYTSLRVDLLGAAVRRVEPSTPDGPAYLEDIGVTFDENLRADLTNASALADKLNADPEAVAKLFNDETSGIARLISQLLDPYVASQGFVDDDIDGIADRIRGIDTSIKRLEDRLALREKQLYREFTSLQQMLNSLVAQQSALGGILGSGWPTGATGL